MDGVIQYILARMILRQNTIHTFQMWKSAMSIHEKILEIFDTTIAPLLDTSGEGE